MKVLTAAQMREVDRRTIEMGIPGTVLMENAGTRVVEFLWRLIRLHGLVRIGYGRSHAIVSPTALRPVLMAN